MKLVFLFALFLVISCGSQQQRYSVEPEFLPYLESFLGDAKKHNADINLSHLVMKFGDISPPFMGFCALGEGVPPSVTISTQYWDKLEDYRKEALIYHELGHCLLGLGHVSEPNQIMSVGSSVSIADYLGNREKYVTSLFLN